MKNKIIVDYDEWQKIQSRLSNKEVILHSNGGGYYTYMYYNGENDLIQGLRREFNELNNSYEERIERSKLVSARLTKLENRNWFERLFNIDI